MVAVGAGPGGAVPPPSALQSGRGAGGSLGSVTLEEERRCDEVT